jgi:transcriptional regulator with XRE-family HTH domain
MARQPHYIKEWRKHRGLTQEQLAERIGIARSYLTKIERGSRRYDQPFLEAAADALRCEPGDLIMRDPRSGRHLDDLGPAKPE